MFEETTISLLFYILIVVVCLIVLFAMGGYLLWNYHLGKPLAKFFWLRISGWTNTKIALFEIFSLTNIVSLEEARKEVGDGYRLYIPSQVEMPVENKGKVKKLLDYILARNVENKTYEVRKVQREQNLIMPKSTYTINGVRTILLWDLHPQLHTDVLEGLKVLVSQGINTLEEFKTFSSNQVNSEKIMFKNYSYRTFYELYLGVRQKYNISITTDDVSNFIGNQFDKNFRESIEAKDYNAMQKSKTDNKFVTYGYLCILIAIVVVSIRILYITFYK